MFSRVSEDNRCSPACFVDRVSILCVSVFSNNSRKEGVVTLLMKSLFFVLFENFNSICEETRNRFAFFQHKKLVASVFPALCGRRYQISYRGGLKTYREEVGSRFANNDASTVQSDTVNQWNGHGAEVQKITACTCGVFLFCSLRVKFENEIEKEFLQNFDILKCIFSFSYALASQSKQKKNALRSLVFSLLFLQHSLLWNIET